LAPTLNSLGLLNDVDVGAFSAYCVAYSRWRHSEEELSKLAEAEPLSRLIMKTTNGNFIQQALVGISNTSMRDVVRYSAEFGLTPSARARIAVDPARGKESKFRGLIGRPKND